MGRLDRIRRVKVGPVEIEQRRAEEPPAGRPPLTVEQITLSPLALKDLKALSLDEAGFRSDLLSTINRHRRFLDRDISSLPVPAGTATAFISIKVGDVCDIRVSRVSRPDEPSPLWRAWQDAMAEYRRIADLRYRDPKYQAMVPVEEYIEALGKFGGLLKCFAAYQAAYQAVHDADLGLLTMTTLNRLMDEAAGRLHDGDTAGAVPYMEALLSHVHATLIQLAPIADDGRLLTPRCILVVEDDRVVATLMARILTDAGMHVDIAGNGVEGAAKIEGGRYDLVITDVIMPHKTGLEMVEDLEAKGPMPPVLVVTGFASDEMVERAKAHRSVADVQSKPFSRRDFMSWVKQILE